MDSPGVNMEEGRFKEIEETLLEFLEKIGFDSIEIIPVSGLMGTGVIEETIDWYNG
jgi:translation elongation factor EF-1alpha